MALNDRDVSAVVVTLAAFVTNFLYSGIYYCSGLFFYYFLFSCGAGKAATALVISLTNGSLYASGVVSGPLTMKYGARIVAVIGAVLSSVGLFLSAFSPHLWMLYITYGITTGFGWGFLMSAAAVSVQQHTTKRRALAAGFSFTGAALGGLTFPLIFSWTESIYGWRGTLLIMAGLQMEALPAAMLFRPPTQLKLDSLAPREADHPFQERSSMFLNTEVQTDEAENATNRLHSISYQKSRPSFKGKLQQTVRVTKRTLKSGGFASVSCIAAYICSFAGSSVLYSFLPMRVASLGLEPVNAAYLMSILSTGELVGRISATFTSCCHDRLPLIFFVTAALLGGIMEAFISYTHTLTSMVVLVSGIGLTLGVQMCVASTVIRDMVGIEKFPWVLGLALGAAGLSNLAFIQLLAWVWQETGNLLLLFIVAGVCLACSGLAYVLYLSCFKGTYKSNRSHPDKNTPGGED